MLDRASWFALALLAVATISCDSDGPGTGDVGADAARADGSSAGGDGTAAKDAAARDSRADSGKVDTVPSVDSSLSCKQWKDWYCFGQYPNYKAMCPPGNDPHRTITCILDGFCYCKLKGVVGDKQCFFTPVPTGGNVCTALEQAFNKGCCKP